MLSKLGLFLCHLLFLIPIVFADTTADNSNDALFKRKIAALLRRTHRPTVQDILQVTEGRPKRFFTKKQPSFDPKQFAEQLAPYIASIEAIFPGATFAFLGRDSANLADIFEAFYLTIGQSDRVIRLNASGISIKSADYLTLAAFLRTNGFDVFSPEFVKASNPFVLIDASGYHVEGNSQSTKLLRAGYLQYLNSGGDPAVIVRKFGFINTLTTRQPGREMRQENLTPDALDQYFDSTANWIASGWQKSLSNKAGTLVLPQDLPTYPQKDIYPPLYWYLPGFGSWTHGLEWHSHFARFQFKKDKVYAPISSGPRLSSPRKRILNSIVEKLNAVQKKTFINRVVQYAKTLGYDFFEQQKQRQKTQKIHAIDWDPYLNYLQGSLEQILKSYGGKGDWARCQNLLIHSLNAQKQNSVLYHARKDDILMMYLENIVNYLAAQNNSNIDIGQMLVAVFKETNMSKSFVKSFIDLLQSKQNKVLVKSLIKNEAMLTNITKLKKKFIYEKSSYEKIIHNYQKLRDAIAEHAETSGSRCSGSFR